MFATRFLNRKQSFGTAKTENLASAARTITTVMISDVMTSKLMMAQYRNYRYNDRSAYMVVQYGKVRVNAGMVNHFTVSLFGLIEKCIWKITLSIQLKA